MIEGIASIETKWQLVLAEWQTIATMDLFMTSVQIFVVREVLSDNVSGFPPANLDENEACLPYLIVVVSGKAAPNSIHLP
jgi:hypothetical protein